MKPVVIVVFLTMYLQKSYQKNFQLSATNIAWPRNGPINEPLTSQNYFMYQPKFLNSCSDDKSIDISDGEVFANGSVLYREKIYHREVQNTYGGKVKVCPCTIYKCYRKCCGPSGVYDVDLNSCVYRPYITFFSNVNRKTKKLKRNMVRVEKLFNIVPIYGFNHLLHDCEPEGKLFSTTLFRGHINISSSGELLVTACNTTETYNVDDYCFDVFVSYNRLKGYKVKPGAYFCDRGSYSKRHNVTENCDVQIQVKILTQSFKGMFVSSAFILITIVIQLLLPEATNSILYRYNMLAHLSSMLTVCIFIAVTRLLVSFDITTDYTVRLVFSTIIYFAFLATFFWLNVMCFDVWKTLSGRRGRVLPGDEQPMFYKYCAYAIGFSTALTFLFLFLEVTPFGHKVLPRKRRQESFLNGITKEIYLKVPIGVICTINAILVVMTVISITINSRKNCQVLTKTGNVAVHSGINKVTKRLKAYTKLLAVTCLSMFSISWYLEVISDMFPESLVLWNIHEVFDYMSGFLTFVCVSGNRLTLRAFKNRFRNDISYVSKPTLDTDLENIPETPNQSGPLEENTTTKESCVLKDSEEKVVTRL